MTGDLPPELDAPRARFIAELGERISTLRQSLARFGTGNEPAGELNALRRRIHALAAGADVLRFTRAAEALANAEAGLAGAGGWDPGAPVRERVARILDLLPSLVLGAPIDLAAELDNPRLEPLREPLCVVVYADATLESLLHKPGALHDIESHATRQPDHAVELVTQLSPDVLLVDGDDPAVSEILPRLRQASGSRQTAVVAVGSFDQPEALTRLMRRGVSRVLPKPTDAVTLQRALRQVTLSESSALQRPINYRKLSSDDLAEAIASEARKAFRDPAASSPSALAHPSLDLGSDAEAQAVLWGAFARLRALAARNTPGVVSFPREGPGGALLLAPDAPVKASSRPASAPVPLHGRRLVVADDDPAIRSLLSNAFAELGATVLPARDGAEALDLAERHWPDAVVSDTLMPQLDGFELCRRLRQDIALSDLPVLLVAWKDHLLACTRTPVSGRALDQLDGGSLTLALRECLATRASLEQRLAQHDAVHGRLDGLTPRLLLQMVCSRSPNALLSLRSGRLTFEFSVADGRPVHARWYDGEQPRGEGKPVLVPFLAVRAGRFSVEPLFSPPPAHFEGDAMAVLNPAAVRTRRASELVAARNTSQVERVVLDPIASEHYAAEFPTQAALLAQLGGGADALRRLLAEDQAGSDPGRLHALLADLARRGAIGALLDRDGRDLLPGGASFHPPSSPPGSGRNSPARSASSRPPVSAPTALAPAAVAPAPAAPAPASSPPPTAAPEAATSAGSKPAPSTLGNAVLEAVSAPHIPRAPSVPAFAPDAPAAATGEAPAEGAAHQAAVARAAFDTAEQPEQPFFSPGEPGAPATDPAPPPAAESESVPAPERVTSTARTHADRALSDPGSLAGPRDDTDQSGNIVSAVGAPDADADALASDGDSWPPSPGARVRSALGRGLLSLGAAAAAFLAIRMLASRSWDSHDAELQHGSAPAALSGATLPAPATAASGMASSGIESTPSALPAPPRVDGGTRAGATSPPVALTFDSELLELAPGTKLPLGQGALEIRSPQRQRIYVDGVLMGDDEERLIPLGPGTYQLRLNDGAHDVERSVEVKAGRRTRISARPSSPP